MESKAKSNDSISDINAIDFNSFQDPLTRISLQYPPEWDIVKGSEEEDFTPDSLATYNNSFSIYQPLSNSSESLKNAMHIMIEDWKSKNMSFDDYVNYYISKLKKDWEKFNLKEKYPVTFAGNPNSYKLNYTYEFENVTSESIDFLSFKNSKVFSISFVTSYPSHSNFIPLIERIIDSFRLDNYTYPLINMPQNHTNLITYRDPIEGVKIKYPADWKIEYIPQSLSRFFNTTSESSSQNCLYGNCEVTFIPTMPNYSSTTLYPRISVIVDRYGADIEGYILHILDNQMRDSQGLIENREFLSNATIGKYDAQVLKYTFNNISIDHYFVRDGDFNYQIYIEIPYVYAHDIANEISNILDTFEITYEPTPTYYTTPSSPQIVIDGKINNKTSEWEWGEEWETSRITLTNSTTRMPSIYEMRIKGWGDDNNIYLASQITGLPPFNGELSVRYDLTSGTVTDSLLISGGNNSTELFKDQFVNESTLEYMDDTSNGGITNGMANTSFFNNTETIELSHPLCSGDQFHDICMSPNTRIEFKIYLNTTDDNSPFPMDRGFANEFSSGSFTINDLLTTEGRGIIKQSVLNIAFPRCIFSR